MELNNRVLYVFCISTCWMTLGLVTMPRFFPLLASSYNINGGLIGLILAIQPIAMMLTIPLTSKFQKTMGIEASICIAEIILGTSLISIAFSTLSE